MLQAKSSLSRLIETIEQGKEHEIGIVRSGKPVTRLVPISATPPEKRIGIAKGRFSAPDDIDAHNDEVVRVFVDEANS